MVVTTTKIEKNSGGTLCELTFFMETLQVGLGKQAVIYMTGPLLGYLWVLVHWPICSPSWSLGLQCNHLLLENSHFIMSLSCLKTQWVQIIKSCLQALDISASSLPCQPHLSFIHMTLSTPPHAIWTSMQPLHCIYCTSNRKYPKWSKQHLFLIAHLCPQAT